LLSKKTESKKSESVRFEKQIQIKNERLISLSNLRLNQENRLDSLYNKGWIASAKKTESIIFQADNNISILNEEIANISSKLDITIDSLSKYEKELFDYENDNTTSDIGPIKYISKLTGLEIDNVVGILILLLIIVFDPLAVALVVATSTMIKMLNENNINKQKNEIVLDDCNLNMENTIVENVENYEAEKYNEEESNIFLANKIHTKNIYLPINKSVVKELNENTQIEEKKIETPLVIEENINLYLKMLDIVFENGNKQIGDKIPNYSILKEDIKNKISITNENDIDNFISICKLLKIIAIEHDLILLQKNYQSSIYLISKV
jgi:hypothetical protein